MVTEVTISGGIAVTANFDGSSIAVSISLSAPLSVTVTLGFGNDPTSIPHNLLTGRDVVGAHTIAATTGLTTALNSKQDAPVNDASSFYGFVRSTLLTGIAAFTDAAIVAGDSILLAFAKLQGQVNAVKVRIGVLEDTAIFDLTTAVDAVSVVITTDINGNPLSLTDGIYCIYRNSYEGGNSARTNPNTYYINDITTDVFNQIQVVAGYNGINHRGGGLLSNSEITITINDGVISWIGSNSGFDTSGSVGVISAGYSIKALIDIPSITKITVKDLNGNVAIKAGTRFVLKKV